MWRRLNDGYKESACEIIRSLRDIDVDNLSRHDGRHEDNSAVIKSSQSLATGNQFFHRDPVRALRHFFIVENE